MKTIRRIIYLLSGRRREQIRQANEAREDYWRDVDAGWR